MQVFSPIHLFILYNQSDYIFVDIRCMIKNFCSFCKKRKEPEEEERNERNQLSAFFVHDFLLLLLLLHYILLLVFIGRWQHLHVIENDDFGKHRNVLEFILSPTTLGNIDGERHIAMV